MVTRIGKKKGSQEAKGLILYNWLSKFGYICNSKLDTYTINIRYLRELSFW